MQKHQFEQFLTRIFESEPASPISTAARYSLFLPGKRIRPLLLLEIGQALGADALQLLHTACALEMVHTYSLIHDDLPCMDDDTMRRGKPAAHVAFDEATALLAGDYLLNRAFDVIAKDTHLQPETRCTLVSMLSSAGGNSGMIGGQMEDIAHKTTSLKMLETMHRKKTGALFGFAFGAAALIANEPVDEFTQLGNDLGYVFQILDDLKDLHAKDKPAGSDVKNGKITILTYLSESEGFAYAETRVQKIISALKIRVPNATTPLTIIDSLMSSV